MGNPANILTSTGTGAVDGDQVTLTYHHRRAGLLTDATVTLSRRDGSYGIRTADGALIAAAGTATTHTDTGVYQYTFTAPSAGLTYVWGVKAVSTNSTSYEEFEYAATENSPDATLADSKWSVIDPPDEWPVSTREAAAHLRTENNDSLCPYIAAATEYAEDRLCAALMPRTIRATFYDGEPLYLPRGPLIQVQTITDRDGTAATDYEIKHIGYTAQVVLTRPVAYPITITYQAGYASAAAIPASIRLAILMHVGTLWENRESITDKPKTIIPHSLEDFYRLKRRSVGVS